MLVTHFPQLRWKSVKTSMGGDLAVTTFHNVIVDTLATGFQQSLQNSFSDPGSCYLDAVGDTAVNNAKATLSAVQFLIKSFESMLVTLLSVFDRQVLVDVNS